MTDTNLEQAVNTAMTQLSGAFGMFQMQLFYIYQNISELPQLELLKDCFSPLVNPLSYSQWIFGLFNQSLFDQRRGTKYEYDWRDETDGLLAVSYCPLHIRELKKFYAERKDEEHLRLIKMWEEKCQGDPYIISYRGSGISISQSDDRERSVNAGTLVGSKEATAEIMDFIIKPTKPGSKEKINFQVFFRELMRQSRVWTNEGDILGSRSCFHYKEKGKKGWRTCHFYYDSYCDGKNKTAVYNDNPLTEENRLKYIERESELWFSRIRYLWDFDYRHKEDGIPAFLVTQNKLFYANRR